MRRIFSLPLISPAPVAPARGTLRRDELRGAPEPATCWYQPWCARGLCIFVAALLLAAAFQGSRGLHETTEGRYALVAQGMLASGNWFEPHLDGVPLWTKPPLTYWILAGGLALGGDNAWSLRLPAILAHAAAAWFVFIFARSLVSTRVGTIAGWIYATGWLPLLGANVISTDIYLACFTTAALAAFAWSLQAPDGGARRRRLTLMWAAWGAAFLTKGPPALLPLAAILAWRLLQPRGRRPAVVHATGLAVFSVIGFSWYVAAMIAHPDLPAKFWSIMVGQNLLGEEAHNRAWWKGLPVFGPPLLLALGVPQLAAYIHAWRRRPRRATLQTFLQRDHGLLLVLLIGLPLVVFFTAGNKLPLYVLPLSAPLAVLLARVADQAWTRRRLAWFIGSSAVLGLAFKATGAWSPSARDMRVLSQEVHTLREDSALPHALVTLVTRRELHGLQFYLRENLLRPDDPEDPVSIARLAGAVVKAVRRGELADGAVLVAATDRAPDIAALLQKRGLTATRRTTRYWDLWLVPPAPAAESDGAAAASAE